MAENNERSSEGDVSGIEIPRLDKDKEKEKKKSGVAWGPSAGTASSFVGATGAAGGAAAIGAAVSRAPAPAAPPSAVASGVGISSFLSPMIEKIAMVAGLSVLGGGSALITTRFLSASAAPQLGAINTTIKVSRRPDTRALSYARQSARGELQFARTLKDEQEAKGRSAVQGTSASGEFIGDDEPAPARVIADVEGVAVTPGLAAAPEITEKTNGLFGWIESGLESLGSVMAGSMGNSSKSANLSSNVGKEFAGKDIFAKGPKFGQRLGQEKLAKFSSHDARSGRAGRMTTIVRQGDGRISLRGGRSFSQSLAYLGGMKKASSNMHKVKNIEESREAAHTQFGNTQISADAAPPPASESLDALPAPNPSLDPNFKLSSDDPDQPPPGGPVQSEAGVAIDNGYQSQMDMVRSLTDSASANNSRAKTLRARSMLYMQIASRLFSNPFTAIFGIFFLQQGLQFKRQAQAAQNQSDNEAHQARSIVQATRQTYQARQAGNCITDALATGTSTAQCREDATVKPLIDPLPQPQTVP